MNPSLPSSALCAVFVTVLVCGPLLTPPLASAQPRGYSQAELASLPKGCHSTQGFVDANPRKDYEDFVMRYGPGWRHVHHYCYALVSIMRYDRYDNPPSARRGLARAALDDLQYVLDRVEPDFVLWPEIVARKTRLLVRERDLEKAMESAKQMQAAMPDRADSYALIAEVQLESARRADAKKTLDDAQSKVKDPDRLSKIRSVLKL